MSWDIIQADARQLPLEDDTADLIVTSPPYWGLRSYRDDGEHYDGQLGSEDSPQQFVDELVDMIDPEWRRVLKPEGSLWLNLGDKYAGAGGAGTTSGLGAAPASARDSERVFPKGDARPKSLLGLPWRIALSLIDRGWILRAEVIWSKPNGLPESVTDRVRRSHEQWFHFTLEPRYFSSVDEIREPHKDVSLKRAAPHRANVLAHEDSHEVDMEQACHPLGRLPGSVWTIPTEPLTIPDSHAEHYGLPDHFAAFPTEWPRRIITGWSPDNGTVLDPMCGTGTVPGVAHRLGRHGIGVDLSADYCRLARWRIEHSGHFDKIDRRQLQDRQIKLL